MKNFIINNKRTILAGIAIILAIALGTLAVFCIKDRCAPWQLFCDHDWKLNSSSFFDDEFTVTCQKCHREVDSKFVRTHFTSEQQDELLKDVFGNMSLGDWFTAIAAEAAETEETTFDNQLERDFNKAMDNLYN